VGVVSPNILETLIYMHYPSMCASKSLQSRTGFQANHGLAYISYSFTVALMRVNRDEYIKFMLVIICITVAMLMCGPTFKPSCIL